MSKLRVWWIPQVGAISKAFYVPVQSAEEGKKVLDMLAAYDAFQLQNRIKPDYTNAGGLQVYNPEIADYEDWYLETDDDYFDEVDDYCEQCERAEELTEFNQALFEQIDWEKIERMTRYEVDIMDKFKGLDKQEYKAIVCETRDFNRWLKENDIDCEVLEEKDCWISVKNNIDSSKSFQKILEDKLGIEIHSLSYLHGQTGTYTDMIEIWYR